MIPQYTVLLSLMCFNIIIPFKVNRLSENKSRLKWNAFVSSNQCSLTSTDQNKLSMSKRPPSPPAAPPPPPVLMYSHNTWDSLFWCKCDLETTSEPSLGKTAPKPPCWGMHIYRLSTLLWENRYKFNARRDKRHFTKGATTSLLFFISLCNDFMLRLQKVPFCSP